MKLKFDRETRAIGYLLAITSLAGIGFVGLSTKSAETYKTGCETYQGHNNNYADGEINLVFDELTLEKRMGGPPNYRLIGDPKTYGDLEIGNKYRLEIKEPVLSVFQEKLLSFENCDQDSE